MLASELINRLKIAIEEHGDLQVFTDDDSGWDQDVKGVHFSESFYRDKLLTGLGREISIPDRIVVGWFDEKDEE